MSNPSEPSSPDFHSESDAHFPENSPDADKGAVHIAGAGTFGMVLLIASLSVLFAASMAAYIAIRIQTHPWPPAGFPHVPNSLWFSTLVILSASVTIQKALSAIRRDDEKGLARYLWATLFVGVAFLGLQTLNWIEFYSGIRATPTRVEGAYLGMFFILTGLHAAHVVGGLIPLGAVIMRTRQGRYSRNFHPGVRYVTAYWHFLDVIWVALFLLIYF